jgi:glutathione S-transferase
MADSDIILYDVNSNFKERAWNPMTWKTRFVHISILFFNTLTPVGCRYCLNFKGIPYKTTWLEYPDIEPLFRRLGIPADEKATKPDGSPLYTVLAIYDPKTKQYITDSMRIAEYLDQTYPDKPLLFPPGTHALINSFSESIIPKWFNFGVQFLLVKSTLALNDNSAEYFRRTREALLGKTFEELYLTGTAKNVEWAKGRANLEDLGKELKKQGGGPYFLGAQISFADFALAGFFLWTRIVLGDESDGWKDITTNWDDGNFGKFMEGLKEYETIV